MSDILSQKQEIVLDTQLGKVKAKVPTLMQRLDIERRRSLYAGGLAVLSQTGVELAEIFATLDVVMLECEKLTKTQNGTWNYDELTEFDLEKLQDVYKKVMDWLDSFRQGMGDKQA
jgi:hypothetical protein